MHLVQLKHRSDGRRIAIVEEPALVLLKSPPSIHELATIAIERNESMSAVANANRADETLELR